MSHDHYSKNNFNPININHGFGAGGCFGHTTGGSYIGSPLNLIINSEETARDRCDTLTDWRLGTTQGEATARANPILVKGLNNLKDKFKKYLITMAIKEKIHQKETQELQHDLKI